MTADTLGTEGRVGRAEAGDSVAVVICAFLEQRLPDVDAALRSLEEQTRPPDEVVVVVDGNAAVTAALEGDSRFKLVSLEQRSGLSTARNAGVGACVSETILFLDDDAVAEPGWIERLAGVINQPDVLGASGASDPLWPGAQPGWFAEEFLWTVGASYRGQPTERVKVRNVYGGCCGLRRSVFTETGGYDPRFGYGPLSRGGGEEAELCLRASAIWPDRDFYYEPAARIKHRVTSDRLTPRYLLRRCYDEGRTKAVLARLQDGALAPERSFSAQLPAAVMRNLRDGLKGEPSGFGRAAMIVGLSGAVLLGLARGRFVALDGVPTVPEGRARS